MKFIYEYRTSDNVRHTGEVVASDRESAFAKLKGNGIRPGRLAEAPGFLNKLFGKGKRWIAIVVLALSLVVVVACFFHTPPVSDIQLFSDVLDTPTRRQPIGDPAVIEKGISTGWSDVFSFEGDRFLASFAIPGSKPAVTVTTEDRLRAALDAPIPSPSTIEARQLVAIVNGMKTELRRYLSSGGTFAGYGRRLIARQNAEIEYYNRAKTEVETAEKSNMSKAELLELWERKNDELRNLGVRPVAMPR